MSNDSKPPGPKRPGGVQRDAQGNVSWQWQESSGTGKLDSTSKLLKALDAPELKIESEAPPDEQRKVESKDAVGGYDPYGRPLSTGAQPAAQPAPPAAAKPKKPAPASESPRSLWSRLLNRR